MPVLEFDTPEDEEVAKSLEKLLNTPTDFVPEEIDSDSLESGDEVPPDEEDDEEDDEVDDTVDDLADDTGLVEESSELPNN